MIVDTHSKPSAARVIVDRLRDITTKPVRYVVNTHFHWDHWHGNEVYPAAYPGAEIITNQLTREAMVRKGLKRIQDHVRQVPAEIARLRAELAAAADRRAAREAPGRPPPRRVVSRRGAGAQARAAHHGLRADDEALPARPGDPPPLPRAAPTPRATSSSTCRRRRWSSPATRSSAGRRSWATATRRTGSTTLDRLAELDFDTHRHGPRRARRAGLAAAPSAATSTTWWTAVREEVATGASLDEVKQRVTARLAPDLREARSRPIEHYRPWRQGLPRQHRARPTRW